MRLAVPDAAAQLMGVCESCDAEGGPPLALRRRVGNQSPLTHTVCAVVTLLDRAI